MMGMGVIITLVALAIITITDMFAINGLRNEIVMLRSDVHCLEELLCTNRLALYLTPEQLAEREQRMRDEAEAHRKANERPSDPGLANSGMVQ